MVVYMFETYLVRNGQEHPVQFLNQLFEGWSLGGNSMPAFTHHHIAAGKKIYGLFKNPHNLPQGTCYHCILQKRCGQKCAMLKIWFFFCPKKPFKIFSIHTSKHSSYWWQLQWIQFIYCSLLVCYNVSQHRQAYLLTVESKA